MPNNKKVVLISCVRHKLGIKARAQDLYISDLFKKSLQYAKHINPDFIFILSAKYGLVRLEDEIEPYDKTLNNMPLQQRKEWSHRVLEELKKFIDIENDEVTILAGLKYYQYLHPYIKNCRIPMEHLPIGKQLKFLDDLP